jgi:conjugal transfer/type IV secretion protein DotA/TraY
MALFQEANDKNQQVTPQKGRVKSVLRYTMMPEILPRIRAIGFHFGHFAYLLALVFASARLIPQTHPVMNAANIGRFGVRQVIAIAANNITWSTKNIDQIAIFSAIIIGLIMIVIQAGLIAFAALVGFNPAEASGVSFFTTENPQSDLVLQTLNVVFGKPTGGDFFFAPDGGVFGISGNYQPIYNTIYQILSLYSMATMVIAVIIVIYYIMTVVGEAAKTGTPFGQRFNSLWAPIRLVVALGLLVPLGSGLNSAQYLTMWTAKMGAGLGNQAWYIFFDNVVSQDPSKYITQQSREYNLSPLVNRIFLAEVCAQGYNKLNSGSLDGDDRWYGGSKTYERTEDLNATNDIFTIEWNKVRDDVPIKYTQCGRLQLDATLTTEIRRGQGSGHTRTIAQPDNELVPMADIYNLVESIVNNTVIPQTSALARQYVGYKISIGGRDPDTNPTQNVRAAVRQLGADVSKQYREGIEQIYTNAVATNLQDKLAADKDKGWAYAGVWYMQIGRIIQQLESPKTTAIPDMKLPDADADAVRGVSGPERSFLFGLIKTGGDEVQNALFTINNLVTRMTGDERKAARSPRATTDTADTIEDTAYEACVGVDEDATFVDKIKCTIFQIFVPDQLFVISSGTTLDPMASLVAAGSEIFTRAFWLTSAGLAGEIIGGAASGLPGIGGVIGGFADGLGGILIILGLLGIGVGFILFFLVPILPFIFFFFAILTWILEIIEAVIAMPLWALAFLKIDGEGMPGQAATSGLFILLSILIRPALIVISLILGYVVFIFGTYLLSMLFDPLLNVVRGDNTKGAQILIFTIIFATLVYNIAMSAFKMVDTIPQSVMRWIGNNPGVFQDGKDPIGDSKGMMTATGGMIAGFAGQQLSGGAMGIGSSVANTRRQREAEEDAMAGIGRQNDQTEILRDIADRLPPRED